MSAPQTMFPHARLAGRKPCYWWGVLSSAELLSASKKLATSYRVPESAVITTAVAIVMAAYAHTPSALVFCVANNRTKPRWARFVGTMYQEVPLVMVTKRRTFDEVLSAMTPDLLSAYQHAHSNPDALAEMFLDVEALRGIRFGRSYRSQDHCGPVLNVNLGTQLEDPGAVCECTSRSGFEWYARNGEGPEVQQRSCTGNNPLYLEVTEHKHTTEVGVRVDTTILSPRHAEAIVRALEALIVTEAKLGRSQNPEEMATLCAGVSPATGPDAVLIDSSFVSLTACASLLRKACGGAPSSVLLERTNGTTYLAAHVALPHPSPDVVDAIDCKILEQLSAEPMGMAPGIYYVHRVPPGYGAEVLDWGAFAISEVVTKRARTGGET